MRRSGRGSAVRWSSLCKCQCCLYRTPLGGTYFEQALPRSLGARQGKGVLSTVNTALSRKALKRRQSLPRKKLNVPLTAEGLKERLKQLSAEERELSIENNTEECDEPSPNEFTTTHEARVALARVLHHGENAGERKEVAMRIPSFCRSPAVSETQSIVVDDKEGDITNAAVHVGCSVLGSDLDHLERDMIRDYHQRGKKLPTFDNIYRTLGCGRKGTSVSDTEPEDENSSGAIQSECGLGDAGRRGTVVVAPSHLHHSTPPTKGRSGEEEEEGGCFDTNTLPADANPHFPPGACDNEVLAPLSGGCAASEQTEITDTASFIPSNSRLSTAVYDAYRQRPADDRLVVLRGTDFWDNEENRARLQELTDYAEEDFAREMLMEGAMDTSEVGYSTNKVRKETLLYFQAHPINEMIQEPFARVRSILPSDGGPEVHFPADDPDTDVDIPTAQARTMARELGLDLIRVGTLYTPINDRRVVAVCTIADHREHMRDMIRFKIKKLGVQRPPTKEGIEVPFRGGTHPHAVRFKSIGIAKHLLLGHVVRINLTDFGTVREGFPVFGSILDEVARQALQLHAYHTAGVVRANYNEVYCYLYPSTGRSPKSTVLHPTQEQLATVRDRCLLEREREVYFDGLYDKKTPRERLTYMRKLQDGTAWADRDDGLSLQRQRDMKVMLGYLPKGNHELYAARGDVNVPAPFRASHPTSVDRWTHPQESNLEQAARGSAVLAKRLSMTVSEMHDRQETAENPATLDRFYYRIQGPALEAGELKEALGLKGNRKRLPRRAPGWATLGMEKVSPQEPGHAAK